ncbi:hypothetical protein L6164_020841 [Bauhinia variegata]|uniref:Uncharacterized protein n=1 Tax=Bauhinia variegata TaxID=167791 RepID=A0ACB9N1F3_BAUVA|nr:hypothetical protein L6164_020841 [Bauhinia variegata]
MERSEEFSEWQHIQSGEGWNTMVVRENYLHGDPSSDFPRTNYEELQIIPIEPQPQSPDDGNSSPSSSSSSSSMLSSAYDENASPSPSPPGWPRSMASEGWKILKLRFGAVSDGFVHAASKVRNCAICVGAFWSMTCVMGAAAAVVVWLVFIKRRRSRVREQSMDQLSCLLSEKDERISELLLQVAQLNEMLSSRRKVPVLRSSS